VSEKGVKSFPIL